MSPEVPGCQLAQASVPAAENIQQVTDTPGDSNQYVHTTRKDPTAERSVGLEFLFFFTQRAAKAIPLMSSMSIRRRVGVCMRSLYHYYHGFDVL